MQTFPTLCWCESREKFTHLNLLPSRLISNLTSLSTVSYSFAAACCRFTCATLVWTVRIILNLSILNSSSTNLTHSAGQHLSLFSLLARDFSDILEQISRKGYFTTVPSTAVMEPVIYMLPARVLYNRGHSPSQMLCMDSRHKGLDPTAGT